jgi:UDP-glucose 4-epimerase
VTAPFTSELGAVLDAAKMTPNRQTKSRVDNIGHACGYSIFDVINVVKRVLGVDLEGQTKGAEGR